MTIHFLANSLEQKNTGSNYILNTASQLLMRLQQYLNVERVQVSTAGGTLRLP
jgi:hypothetical protein